MNKLIYIVLIALLPPAAAWSGGIRESEVREIPAGRYVGKYVRNADDYTAIVRIEDGTISSIRLKYNDTPFTEPRAVRQAELVAESDSTAVRTLPSPGNRNKSVLNAIELALKAGLKMVE